MGVEEVLVQHIELTVTVPNFSVTNAVTQGCIKVCYAGKTGCNILTL